MPFIGNQPALAYTSFAKQDFTTSATTNYVLNQAVTNANEIALFINFVRQEPTTAYTASGTTLTLTSATSASDDMYCIFLGKALQTVNPPAGSVGISQLSATGTKDATTFLRGDNTFAEAGGGKVLQIVQATDTVGGNTNSTSFVATNTSVTITPSSTSSKILVFATGTTEQSNGRGYLTIFRNTTNLVADALVINQVISLQNPFAMQYLDSPSTTSATTYKIYIRVQNGADTIYTGGGTLVMNAMEIAG